MINKELRKILISKKNIIQKCKIICIGDIILDHYIYGKVDRMSPEAPIPILLADKETHQLGGVGNVAKNITSLGGRVSLFYLASSDNSSKIIKDLILKDSNIRNIPIYNDRFRVPLKTRYINKSKHMIRVDKENTKFKLDQKSKKEILKKLDKEIKKNDLIVLSDYSKGLLDTDLIAKIVSIAKKYTKVIIADPKKNDLSCYANMNLLTPNQKEITDASQKKTLNEKELVLFSRNIIKKYNINNILITRSEKGMILISTKFVEKFKASAKIVHDVTGAGDTVIGILALMLALGFNKKDASVISNYAAGLVVGKIGTASIKYKELIS
ncbi:PfkB family carbohydrate kinase [Pelagibacteraceae bacterium]|nr:PfkB family carbohydrate kinase [Pelagibacteraceae bacterium]